MIDQRTLDVYEARAGEYATRNRDGTWPPAALTEFAGALSPGGAVLDLGCGPGHAAAWLASQGFAVTATDASPRMVALAARAPGVAAHEADFDASPGLGPFHGVWASFSLLHAPRADMPRHLAALHGAMHASGRLHLGLKTGTGTARDALGRLYTYYTEDELRGLLRAAGFTPGEARFDEEIGLDGTLAPYILLAADA